MKVVHHCHYIYWLERARFSMALHTADLQAQDFERMGFYLPVIDLQCRYMTPAYLDNRLVLYLRLIEQEKAVVSFDYELFNRDNGAQIMKARTDHAFVNLERKLLIRVPEIWERHMQKIKEQHPDHFIQKPAAVARER
jgi:acyl-CoA thioester hydrolase